MIETFSEEYWDIETLQNIENDVAELIAQRDELLESCQLAHKVITDYWEELGSGCNLDVIDLNTALEAAVAKAERGEEE